MKNKVEIMPNLIIQYLNRLGGDFASQIQCNSATLHANQINYALRIIMLQITCQ